MDLKNQLINSENYWVIIPTSDMSRNEQLGTLARLFVYVLIIFLIFARESNYIYIPIIGLVFVCILYILNMMYPDSGSEGFDTNNFLPIKPDVDYSIQTAHYDFDGKLILGNTPDIRLDPANPNINFNPSTYKTPTPSNPFMNPIITDFNTNDPPVASNADDEEIKDQIDASFNHNLFMDTSDLFNVKNSQRIWYTVPMPAIPPDQTTFAEWLFKSDATCKEDQSQCLRYVDLRYER